MDIQQATITVAPYPNRDEVRLPSIKFSKIIISCLCVFLILSQFACAPTKYYSYPSEESRADFGMIAVVPDCSIPEQNFSPDLAKGRISGAGIGAAGGASVGATGGTLAAISCVYCLFFLPLFVAGGAVIGGVAGGVAGAINAVPAEDAEKIEAVIKKVFTDLQVQETMADHVLRTGEAMTRYRFMLTQGQCPNSPEVKLNYECFKLEADSVFVTSVKSIGFEGGKGGDPAISLVMQVDTKLVRISDSAEIYSGSFKYKSRTLKASVWAADDARLLREEFENCSKDLSERIIEEAFMLVEFPVISSRRQFCMLSPIYPQWERILFKDQAKYVLVDSHQPTFKWESFPREIDIVGGSNRISNVAYDLKVWKVEDDFPVDLVYRRQGLSDSSHKIEEPLMRSSKYFWTVRARFELDNQPRVTKWAYSQRPFPPRGLSSDDPCNLNYIPTPNYYRFMTAPEGK